MSAYLVAGGAEFWVEPIERIRLLRDRARSLAAEFQAALVPADSDVAARPGTAVWALRVWGDVNLGSSGALTEVDGPWATLFSHSSGVVPAGAAAGEILLMLSTARIVGERLLGDGESEIVMLPGSRLGTCVFAGPATVVARLDRVPDALEVAFEWDDWPSWNLSMAVGSMWSGSRAAAFAGFLRALEPLDAMEPKHLAAVRVYLDGETDDEIVEGAEESRKSNAERIAGRILRLLDARAQAGTLSGSVRVRVAAGVRPR
jgi:hypothetical protein